MIGSKILKIILGLITIAENEFRSSMNHELKQELEGDDILTKTKQQRIKWLSHLWKAGTGVK